MDSQPFKVYVDGIFDLFHQGHVNVLKKAVSAAEGRAAGRKVELLVGVCGDGVTEYKRKTIMDLEERGAALRAHDLVGEVIENSPLRLTDEFIRDHRIDLVVHGDDYTREKRDYYYGAAVEAGKYAEVPYTPGISTSELIKGAKMEGRFSVSMANTLMDEAELVRRIATRSWDELKVNASSAPLAVQGSIA